jgi:hypothetical protein
MKEIVVYFKGAAKVFLSNEDYEKLGGYVFASGRV